MMAEAQYEELDKAKAKTRQLEVRKLEESCEVARHIVGAWGRSRKAEYAKHPEDAASGVAGRIFAVFVGTAVVAESTIAAPL